MLWLQLNQMPLGSADSVSVVVEDDKRVTTAGFIAPPGALRDGHNALVLRNEGEPTTPLSIDLRVG